MKFALPFVLAATGSWLCATTIKVPSDASDLHATVALAPESAAPSQDGSELLPAQSPAPIVLPPAPAQPVTPVPETTGLVVFAFLGVLFMLRRRSA